jgi:hypothetical protein
LLISLNLIFFFPFQLPETSIWHKSFAPPKPKEKTNVSAFITTKSKEVVVETKKVITVKPKIGMFLFPIVNAMYSPERIVTN